jgi:two-component system, chemotaxis family, chemotaxis protein CheY
VVLRGSGYAVALADEGGKALAWLRGGLRPHLVLLDMITPGRDGWDFLIARRSDPALAAIPVVIHTSLGVASPEWAAGLGASGFLRKPAEAEQLLDEVRRRLRPSPAD